MREFEIDGDVSEEKEMKIFLLAAALLTASSASGAQINVTDGFGNPIGVSGDPYWPGDAAMGQPASKGYAANNGKGSGNAGSGNTGVGASGRGSGGNGGGGTGGSGTGAAELQVVELPAVEPETGEPAVVELQALELQVVGLQVVELQVA